MKEFSQNYFKEDIFFLLKSSTVKKIRDLLKWANSYSLLTQVTFLDCMQSFSRQLSDKKIEEILSFINQKNKINFRVILRSDFNWYPLLSDDKHIEDIVEVAMWGIEIGSKEHFIHCFLKKEYMPELSKFGLIELR